MHEGFDGIFFVSASHGVRRTTLRGSCDLGGAENTVRLPNRIRFER